MTAFLLNNWMLIIGVLCLVVALVVKTVEVIVIRRELKRWRGWAKKSPPPPHRFTNHDGTGGMPHGQYRDWIG